MAVVRSQLRSAQQAFRSARYPGDLAAELLPAPGVVRTMAAALHRRQWLVLGGVGASAVAAAVMLSLLLSRVNELPRPWPSDGAQRGALVDWLPVAPEGLPLPKFTTPSLRLDVPEVVPAVERYQDLAVQYRKLQELAPHMDLRLKVPTLTDLPERGAEWIHRVWESGEPAESA